MPQSEIVIGVPAYQNPAEVVLPKILSLPFEKQRQNWQLPDANNQPAFVEKLIL